MADEKKILIQLDLGTSVQDANKAKQALDDYKKSVTDWKTASEEQIAQLKVLQQDYKIQQAIILKTIQSQKEEEGSYNKLARAYEAGKLLLNSRNEAVIKANGGEVEFTKRLKDTYEQMSKLQMETGKHTLEVGKYEKATKGLTGSLSELQLASAKIKEGIGGLNEKFSKFPDTISIAVGSAIGGFISNLAGNLLDGAKNLFNKFINLTDESKNKYEAIMKGMDTATSAFYKTILTGDFSNLLKNLDEAYERGKKYQETLQSLTKTQEALSVLRLKENEELADLKVKMSDQNITLQQRKQYAQEYLDKQEELFTKEKENATKQYENQLRFAKLSKEKFESYLIQDAITSDLREKAEERNREIADTEEKMLKTASTIRSESAAKMVENELAVYRAKIEGLKKNYDDVGKYAALLREIEGNKKEEIIKNTTDAYKKVLEANSAFNEATIRQRRLVNKQIAEDEKKQDEENKKIEQDRKKRIEEETKEINRQHQVQNKQYQDFIKEQLEIKKELDKVNEEILNAQEKRRKELNDNSEKDLKKQLSDEEKAQQERLIADQKFFDDVEKAEAESLKRREELQKDFFNVTSKLLSLGASISSGLQEIERLDYQQTQDTKQKALDAQLKQGLISEKDYNDKSEALKNQALLAEKNLKKEYADIDFEIKTAQILVELASGTMAAFASPLSIATGGIVGGVIAALLASVAGVQIALANKQRESIQKLYTGGQAKGGQGGIDDIPAMLTEDEAVLNQKSMRSNRIMSLTGTPKQIASTINSSFGGVAFADGGMARRNITTPVNNLIENQNVIRTILSNLPPVYVSYTEQTKQFDRYARLASLQNF